MHMAGRLQGKVCIVTGSGSGIGRASALMFARMAPALNSHGSRI
jgi:NAD(P)-dependent dehydrogenase (short-subunit alcohol dehydrogenase family)